MAVSGPIGVGPGCVKLIPLERLIAAESDEAAAVERLIGAESDEAAAVERETAGISARASVISHDHSAQTYQRLTKSCSWTRRQ